MHRPLQKETLEIQWVARLSVEPRPPIKMTIFCPWFFKKAYQFQQAASISSVDCLSTGIPTDRFLCCSWRLQAARGEVGEERRILKGVLKGVSQQILTERAYFAVKMDGKAGTE